MYFEYFLCVYFVYSAQTISKIHEIKPAMANRKSKPTIGNIIDNAEFRTIIIQD